MQILNCDVPEGCSYVEADMTLSPLLGMTERDAITKATYENVMFAIWNHAVIPPARDTVSPVVKGAWRNSVRVGIYGTVYDGWQSFMSSLVATFMAASGLEPRLFRVSFIYVDPVSRNAEANAEYVAKYVTLRASGLSESQKSRLLYDSDMREAYMKVRPGKTWSEKYARSVLKGLTGMDVGRGKKTSELIRELDGTPLGDYVIIRKVRGSSVRYEDIVEEAGRLYSDYVPYMNYGILKGGI